jgi:hypothetical protein
MTWETEDGVENRTVLLSCTTYSTSSHSALATVVRSQEWTMWITVFLKQHSLLLSCFLKSSGLLPFLLQKILIHRWKVLVSKFSVYHCAVQFVSYRAQRGWRGCPRSSVLCETQVFHHQFCSKSSLLIEQIFRKVPNSAVLS